MATEDPGNPRMYTELASWWPLLSAPEEYAEEAVFSLGAVARGGGTADPAKTLLELGSGGATTPRT